MRIRCRWNLHAERWKLSDAHGHFIAFADELSLRDCKLVVPPAGTAFVVGDLTVLGTAAGLTRIRWYNPYFGPNFTRQDDNHPVFASANVHLNAAGIAFASLYFDFPRDKAYNSLDRPTRTQKKGTDR